MAAKPIGAVNNTGKEADLLAEIARLKASLQGKESELEQLWTTFAQYEH